MTTEDKPATRTATHQKLLVALAAGHTQPEAARIVGVTTRTVRRYVADPLFRAELEETMRELVAQVCADGGRDDLGGGDAEGAAGEPGRVGEVEVGERDHGDEPALPGGGAGQPHRRFGGAGARPAGAAVNRLARILRLEQQLGQATQEEKRQSLAALTDEQLEKLEAAWADGEEAVGRCWNELRSWPGGRADRFLKG
jgi:hypothetical protein